MQDGQNSKEISIISHQNKALIATESYLSDKFKIYGKGSLYTFTINIFIVIISFIIMITFSAKGFDPDSLSLLGVLFLLSFLLFLYTGATIIRRAWKQLLIFNPRIKGITPNKAIFLLLIPIVSYFWFFIVIKGWAKSFNRARKFAPKDSLKPVSVNMFLTLAWLNIISSFSSLAGYFLEEYFTNNFIFALLGILLGILALSTIFLYFMFAIYVAQKMYKSTNDLCMLNYK